MIGAEFDFSVVDLRKRLIFEHKLFTGSSVNKNLLRILPALNINENHLDEFESKMKQALSQQIVST